MRAPRDWLLALDLSGPSGVLLLQGPGGLFQRSVEAGARVSGLFDAASAAVSEAGIVLGEIGLVGVARGPGSFTGVRVAVMAAKTMAFALGVPVVAPTSLEAAAAAAGDARDAVLVVMDARRGHVYHALYRTGGGMPIVLDGPGVSPPEALIERLPAWGEEVSGTLGIIGVGADPFSGMWPEELLLEGLVLPDPEALAGLCRLHHASGDALDPISLLPLYIRRPDAAERFADPGGGAACS